MNGDLALFLVLKWRLDFIILSRIQNIKTGAFMNIPGKCTCEKLVLDNSMPEHIRDHSRQVCRVALLLTGQLAAVGISLNEELVRTAALLHDITKARSFTTRENHAETGEELLADLGYPEVGYIVGRHVVLDQYPEEATLPNEAEIVNYADKRVLHDRIVSLSDRMAYIVERYGETPEKRERLQLLQVVSEGLEKRIFSFLSIVPDDVELMIAQADNRQTSPSTNS